MDIFKALRADLKTRANLKASPAPQPQLAIMVNHEGDECAGFYQLYPANDESEPDFPFQNLFEYDRDFLPPVSQSEARAGAEREAQRVADRIGGEWFTNER